MKIFALAYEYIRKYLYALYALQNLTVVKFVHNSTSIEAVEKLWIRFHIDMSRLKYQVILAKSRNQISTKRRTVERCCWNLCWFLVQVRAHCLHLNKWLEDKIMKLYGSKVCISNMWSCFNWCKSSWIQLKNVNSKQLKIRTHRMPYFRSDCCLSSIFDAHGNLFSEMNVFWNLCCY